MSAERETGAMSANRAAALRWGACLLLALCFHGAGAAALMARWNDSADLVANAPVITIELAPVPVAPEITPNELPPGPQQMQAEPEPRPEKPLEKVEVPPAPQAELEMTPPPKPVQKPKDNKPKQKHASLASAPSTAENRAERAAAPMPGAASHNSDAVPNWKSQLVAKLERYKRYPSEAQSRGEQGLAQLAFSIDRDGGVHNARIVHSSGSSVLDRETLMLAERAQPLPPPPPEMAGAQIAVVVPIRYNIR
jgi:periplasmic protein TonB